MKKEYVKEGEYVKFHCVVCGSDRWVKDDIDHEVVCIRCDGICDPVVKHSS